MTQNKDKNIYSYSGELSFDIIEDILHQSKDRLDEMGYELVVKKRVYSVLVECLENTYKHNKQIRKNPNHEQVELVILKTQNSFTINISNYIDNKNLTELTNKIKKVNSLDLSELNMHYREAISKARISNKGGAGLGIIEIARNSRQEIRYNVIQENGSGIHLNLQVKVADKTNKNC